MNIFSDDYIKAEIETFRVLKEENGFKDVIKDIRMRLVMTDEKKRTVRMLFVLPLNNPVISSYKELKDITKEDIYQWLNSLPEENKRNLEKNLKEKFDPVEYTYTPEYSST